VPLLDEDYLILSTIHAKQITFFTDLLEARPNLLELSRPVDASILDDEILADGAKAAVDKLQALKRNAETRIELKRRLLAHTLQQERCDAYATAKPKRTARSFVDIHFPHSG